MTKAVFRKVEPVKLLLPYAIYVPSYTCTGWVCGIHRWLSALEAFILNFWASLHGFTVIFEICGKNLLSTFSNRQEVNTCTIVVSLRKGTVAK